MENSVFIGVVVVLVFIILVVKTSSGREKRKVFKNNAYSYLAKPLLMTRTEADFFVTLEQAVSERYYVFPQVHLSALLDHRVKGQDWRYAFRHINGKSVDYVLCDRQTLRPTYAVELDDFTHDRKGRRERDREVERIFAEASLPLVRFTDRNASAEDIIRALSDTRR